MTAPADRPRGVSRWSVLGSILFSTFMNELGRSPWDPCYFVLDYVTVARVSLEEDNETLKAWWPWRDLPPNLTRCQRIAAEGKRRWNKMGDIANIPQVKHLGVTVARNFKPSKNDIRAAVRASLETLDLRSTIYCGKPEVLWPPKNTIARLWRKASSLWHLLSDAGTRGVT